MKSILTLAFGIITYYAQAQSCTIIQPKQLEILDGAQAVSTEREGVDIGGMHISGTIETVQGYRIQIYSGENKKEALAVKSAFNGKFRKTNSYYHYVAPNYRISVGDYITRAEALQALKDIKKYFSGAMIVPSKVTKKDLSLE
jgi:hypothetical protein